MTDTVLLPTGPGPVVTEVRVRRAPWPVIAVATVVALAFAAPLLYLVVENVSDLGEFVGVLGSGEALNPLTTTLALALVTSASCAVLGTAVAWLVVRTDLPGRRVWRVLTMLPLAIPSYVGALALVASFTRGGLLDEWFGFAVSGRVRGFWWAFVVLTLLSYPYVMLPVAARLAALPPSLEESARALGRRPVAVFRTVVLPQVRGAIAAGGLLVFLYVVSEFGAVSILRVDTLAVRIEATRLFERSTSLALGLLLAVVALAVVTVERSIARRGRPAPATVSAASLRWRLGAAKVPAFLFLGALTTIALVAPLVVLARWAWRAVSGGSFSGGSVDLGSLVAPALNTASVASVAAIVTTCVVLPIAYLTVRYRSRVAGAINAVVVGGFALPGLVIALAAVFWVLQTPGMASVLYQSFPLLVFAYVVHFGAQALRSAQVAVGAVPERLDDAARSLGASRLRRFRTVELPLMIPGLGAGAGLVLLAVTKELPATLLLAPTGFETLAIRVWSATERNALGEAGLVALVLVAVSAVFSYLLTIRRMERIS